MIVVDIVTITFNNLDGLKKTYHSIKNQTYSDYINWIVIDGNSDDGTFDFLNNLNSRINLSWLSEKDDGIYDAMNKGIEYSNGDYLIFMNAGDRFENNYVIGEVISKMDSLPLLIYGNYYRELKNGALSYVQAKPIWYIYHSLPTSHQAIFYNRKAIGELRYDLKYKVSSDYHFTSIFIKKMDILKNKDYAILDSNIAIFEYNGLSRNNLQQLFKDAYNIQDEVFHLNSLFRVLSYCIKIVRNLSL